MDEIFISSGPSELCKVKARKEKRIASKTACRFKASGVYVVTDKIFSVN